jgi:hypothetical protein
MMYLQPVEARMGTELIGPQDAAGQEYRRVPYTLGANGVLTPVAGGAQAINLEPGSTIMLLLPQSGAASGIMYNGGGMQSSQPVIITAPSPQSPNVLVINTEAKKPDNKAAKATREPFKNI